MSTDATTPSADQPATAVETVPAAAAAGEKSLIDRAEELLDGAGEKIEEAFDATVEAAKKHPIAAGAIAAGAAAAVAGAVYGAAKLFGSDDSEGDDAKKGPKAD